MAIVSLFLQLRPSSAPIQLKAAVALFAILLAVQPAMGAPLFPRKRPPKNVVMVTLFETARYTPCRDGCSAATEPARAFCFKSGKDFLVADGTSYLHENKFESLEDLVGTQVSIQGNGRWVWIKPADRPEIKLRRGSIFEDFKDPGCMREVHRPIVALAARTRPRSKIPPAAFAIAGPGRGDFQPLYLWYQCGLDGDAIACQRWYRNGKPTTGDWYCAQPVDGAKVDANFAVDPLLSRTGRLVLTSGAVLRPDLRERLDGKLENPGHACF
jgi:hypothetical protein